MRLSQLRVFHLCVLFAFLIGCSATPVMVQQSSKNGSKTVVPEWNNIFLLTPTLSFKEVKTEQELPPERYGSESILEHLVDYVGETVSQKGFKVIHQTDMAGGQQTELGQVLSSLNNLANKLTKRRKPKRHILDTLHALHDHTGAEGLLVHVFRVKVGSGGTWDPNSGAITPGSSTSHIIACLIDIETGEVMWRNEVFVRCMLDPEKLHECLDMLYSTFPVKQKEVIK